MIAAFLWPIESSRPGVQFTLALGFFLVAGFFLVESILNTSDLELAHQWLHCQAPGTLGPALGMVGPVSVYCDLMR